MTEFAIKIGSLEEAQNHVFKFAVMGLASQGWATCVSTVGQVQGCTWNLGVQGVHCAIGWLIPRPTQLEEGRHSEQIVEEAMAGGLLMPEFHDGSHRLLKRRSRAS